MRRFSRPLWPVVCPWKIILMALIGVERPSLEVGDAVP